MTVGGAAGGSRTGGDAPGLGSSIGGKDIVGFLSGSFTADHVLNRATALRRRIWIGEYPP
jgi:hypothetical protein